MCCRKNGAIHNNRDTKSFIKNNDAELYDYLCGIVDLNEYDDNIKEVILCILYDIEYRPICPVCRKHPTKFNSNKYKYSLFCSAECEEKAKEMERILRFMTIQEHRNINQKYRHIFGMELSKD